MGLSRVYCMSETPFSHPRGGRRVLSRFRPEMVAGALPFSAGAVLPLLFVQLMAVRFDRRALGAQART